MQGLPARDPTLRPDRRAAGRLDDRAFGDDPATRERLAAKRIPTFVVRSAKDGPELGRIVESPSSDSLEGDLLAIAQRSRTEILA